MISDDDVERLQAYAESLPMNLRHDIYDDYVENLFLAVLDLMTKVATVNKALTYYRMNRRGEVHDLQTLTVAMERFPDDKEGNTELAQFLWGNNHWTRAANLRRLAAYFESIGVIDQPTLEAWAKSANFKCDFEGRVKGLGFAVYQWILIRCEVDTVKPDRIPVVTSRPASLGRSPMAMLSMSSSARQQSSEFPHGNSTLRSGNTAAVTSNPTVGRRSWCAVPVTVDGLRSQTRLLARFTHTREWNLTSPERGSLVLVADRMMSVRRRSPCWTQGRGRV